MKAFFIALIIGTIGKRTRLDSFKKDQTPEVSTRISLHGRNFEYVFLQNLKLIYATLSEPFESKANFRTCMKENWI